MRIFLDANILFSAAKSSGAIRTLVRMLADQGHECWVDPFVIEEARRNLAAKFPEALADLQALIGTLQVGAIRAGTEAYADTTWLPEKDRPVLQAAIALRCDVLVTGDQKHFGAGFGKRIGGVSIHSPRSLAEAILRRS